MTFYLVLLNSHSSVQDLALKTFFSGLRKSFTILILKRDLGQVYVYIYMKVKAPSQ